MNMESYLVITHQPNNYFSVHAVSVYGYGTAAIFIISVSSLIGLCIVQWNGTAGYKYLISCMLGLAVGALVGDAILHLGPQVHPIRTVGFYHHNNEFAAYVDVVIRRRCKKSGQRYVLNFIEGSLKNLKNVIVLIGKPYFPILLGVIHYCIRFFSNEQWMGGFQPSGYSFGKSEKKYVHPKIMV